MSREPDYDGRFYGFVFGGSSLPANARGKATLMLSTIEVGIGMVVPRSFVVSYMIFMARSCNAAGLSLPVTSRGGTHGCPSEGTITDQALDDAVNRKRDQLISKIGSCIPQLIEKYLRPTKETHWLNDPRRIHVA